MAGGIKRMLDRAVDILCLPLGLNFRFDEFLESRSHALEDSQS